MFEVSPYKAERSKSIHSEGSQVACVARKDIVQSASRVVGTRGKLGWRGEYISMDVLVDCSMISICIITYYDCETNSLECKSDSTNEKER